MISILIVRMFTKRSQLIDRRIVRAGTCATLELQTPSAYYQMPRINILPAAPPATPAVQAWVRAQARARARSSSMTLIHAKLRSSHAIPRQISVFRALAVTSLRRSVPPSAILPRWRYKISALCIGSLYTDIAEWWLQVPHICDLDWRTDGTSTCPIGCDLTYSTPATNPPVS